MECMISKHCFKLPMATSPVWLCCSGVSLITSASSSIEVTTLSNTFKAKLSLIYFKTNEVSFKSLHKIILVHNVAGNISKWKGFRVDHSVKCEEKNTFAVFLDPVHPQKVDWSNLLLTMQSSRSDRLTKIQRSNCLVYELVAYDGGKKHFLAFLRPTLDRQYVLR